MNGGAKTAVIVAAIWALVCGSLFAYKFSSFTDLESLMERSKFIVAARIASLGEKKNENDLLP